MSAKPRKKFGFDPIGFLERFDIADDLFLPFRTPYTYHVVWTFRLGQSKLLMSSAELTTKMHMLAAQFVIAISDYNLISKANISDPDLSVREYQCLSLVARGFSNEQISSELSISAQTAKFHVSNMMRKLGTKTRADTVAKAARSGWLVN